MIDKYQQKSRLSRSEKLAEWYRRHYGRCLSALMDKTIDDLLSRLPVQSVLRIGLNFAEPDSSDDINAKQLISLSLPGAKPSFFSASAENLPVKNNILDCVILMHELNVSENPHRILRETERVLAEDGFVAIVGFNPYSMIGSIKPFGQLFGKSPWDCRFHSISKLRDWLQLLDFEMRHIDTFSYTLPFWSEKLACRFGFYQKLATHRGSVFGNIYCIIARKRTIPLTRIRLFKQKRVLKFPATGLSPTAGRKAEDLMSVNG